MKHCSLDGSRETRENKPLVSTGHVCGVYRVRFKYTVLTIWVYCVHKYNVGCLCERGSLDAVPLRYEAYFILEGQLKVKFKRVQLKVLPFYNDK